MKIENQIQFTDIAEVSVKYLHEMMYNIEDNEFIVFFFYAGYEVKRCISLENNFVVSPF